MARGDGRLFTRGDMIWAQATIKGNLYRFSTGKRLSSLTKHWYENTKGIDFVKSVLEKQKEEAELSLKDVSLEKFGMDVIKLTSENRRESSQKDVVRVFKKHILPFFKHYEMEDIKSIDIIKFVKHLKGKMSDERAKRIKNVLSTILAYAYDNQIIDRNPFEARTVKDMKFNTTPKDQRVYTSDEVNAMLSKSYGWLRVFLEISFTSGLRVGEVMALKWSDIILEHGIMFVSRSISKGVITEGSNGDKNHDRSIPVLPRTLEVLKNYYEVRPSNEWLFINKDGRPFLESKTIVDYHFKPFVESIGVEYKTLQANRRTYASLMSYGGSDLSQTKKIMGHSKSSNTIHKHYIKQGVLNNENYKNMAQAQEGIFNQMIGN